MTMARIAELDPNMIMWRCCAVPWRSSAGMGRILLSSMLGTVCVPASVAVPLIVYSQSLLQTSLSPGDLARGIGPRKLSFIVLAARITQGIHGMTRNVVVTSAFVY